MFDSSCGNNLMLNMYKIYITHLQVVSIGIILITKYTVLILINYNVVLFTIHINTKHKIKDTTVQAPYYNYNDNLQSKFCMQKMHKFLQSKCVAYNMLISTKPREICMQTITIGCMQPFDDMVCTTRYDEYISCCVFNISADINLIKAPRSW